MFLPNVLLIILAILFGLLFGSFANVLIFRLPRGEEVVKTPSHCMACGHRLRWYELIPVFSWLIQAGKCRACKARISPVYPIVECVNAALWAVCALRFGLNWYLPVALALSTGLLALSVIDWRTQEIPDDFPIFFLVVGVLWNVYALAAGKGVLRQNVIGFFAASAILLLLLFVSRGGMGGGDIKLMAVCGLILGWQQILLALGLASVVGTLIMLPLHIIQKKQRREPIPFGPFLAAGVWLAMCFGGEMIRWYLHLVLG